jgi:hypothetical protein
MAESPKVARAEILDSKQCWSETTLIRTPIKTNEYPSER